MLLYDALQVIPTRHCVSREFVAGVLKEYPGAQLAITRDVRTGQIVGAKIGRTHFGVMVLDPFDDRPVSWQDVDGKPEWSRSGRSSTGAYRSAIVGPEALMGLLK